MNKSWDDVTKEELNLIFDKIIYILILVLAMFLEHFLLINYLIVLPILET